MKLKIVIVAFTSLVLSSTASAIEFDFVKLIDGSNGNAGGDLVGKEDALVSDFVFDADTNDAMGERGFDSFEWTKSGLKMTGSASNSDGTTEEHTYFDGKSGGRPGGLGVCTVLDGSQCKDPSDDNTSDDGEILELVFGNTIELEITEMRDSNHYDLALAGAGVEVMIGNGSWTAFTSLTTVLTGSQFKFRTTDDEFYISSLDATVVPLPAAVWLFGSALLGLAGFGRLRRRNVA